MAIDIYLSLGLSIVAIAVSVISFVFTYRRSRKTEQLKLCFDLSDRLSDAENKIGEILNKLKGNTTDQQLIEQWNFDLYYAYLSYLDIWEFFSFLVNTKEIHDEKILDYYMESLKLSEEEIKTKVQQITNRYPHIKAKNIEYKEIDKLLKKRYPDYYSSRFESKKNKIK